MRYVSIWPLSHDILEWFLHPKEEGNQWNILGANQRYTYSVLQTIQMKLILLCVWAERAFLGSAKNSFKIQILDLNRRTHIQLNVWGRV